MAIKFINRIKNRKIYNGSPLHEVFICPNCSRMHFPKESWDGYTMICKCGSCFKCEIHHRPIFMEPNNLYPDYDDRIIGETVELYMRPTDITDDTNIYSRGIKIPLENGTCAAGTFDGCLSAPANMKKLCRRLNRQQREQLVCLWRYKGFDDHFPQTYRKFSEKIKDFITEHITGVVLTSAILTFVALNVISAVTFNPFILAPTALIDAFLILFGFITMLTFDW